MRALQFLSWVMTVSASAQPASPSPRSTPGSSMSGSKLGYTAPTTRAITTPSSRVAVTNGTPPDPNAPQSQPLDPQSFDEHLKLGDYIELDDSVKNEMYGTIDFPNADLKDIIKAIAKLSGKNFILDHKIDGHKVTIVSPQPVTKQEAYNAFLSALYMNDFTIVTMGKFLKIVDAKTALQSNIRVFVGDYAPASEEIVTVLYPLRFLNAEEIQRFLTDLVPRNGRISYYPNTNTLVMTDTGLNLRRIIAILKSIDVAGHEDQLETIQIKYANAKGISQLIDDILAAQSGGRSAAPGIRAQPQKTRGGGTITKIVPDERTNSLIVLANGRGLQELKNLVDKLDTPNAAGGGNIHIYYCKNAVADDLATTLNALISGQQANKNGATGGGTSSYPPPGGFYSPVRTGSNDGSVKLEGNIKVTADKPTNSLVIVASGSDFAALKAVIQRLDIPRRQVFVAATIMEIEVDDTKSVGVGMNVAQPGITSLGAFFPPQASAQDLLNASQNPVGLTGLIAGFRIGQTWNVNVGGQTISLGTVQGLIKALVETKHAHIMHQPNILTSDNQESTIKVDQQVPVPSNSTSIATTTGGLPSTTTTYSKEKVSVQLKITPQLGEGSDLIKLKVQQEIDSFAPATGAAGVGGQVVITQRNADTSVVVRDNDTVVVGGLQKTTTSDDINKFPILGDIPILGWLFKGKNSDVTKSNLMLFLTPRIIKEYSDLLEITGDKIQERKKDGAVSTEIADRLKDEVAKLEAKNTADKAKPVTKLTGFKPLNEEDKDEPTPNQTPAAGKVSKPNTNLDKNGAPLKSEPKEAPVDSAFINPDNMGMGDAGAPTALQNVPANNTSGAYNETPMTLTPPAGNNSGTTTLGTQAPALAAPVSLPGAVNSGQQPSVR